MARSMFQRRQYAAIAETLALARADANDMFSVALLDQLASRLSDMFKADNDRFSRERFETACTKK